MEWLNLSITQLAAPEYRRSSLADRGVWLTLLGYCVQQENYGRIAGAQAWSDFEHVAVLGVVKTDIAGTHLLWSYEGGDLVVSGYPAEKQREIAAKRKAARKGNRIRWGESSHSDSHSDSDTESRKERKGKEGEGKEKGKGKSGASAPASAQKPSYWGECRDYFPSIGSSEVEAQKFFDHFEANGWRQGGRTPLRDWRAAARNWARRAAEFSREKKRVVSGAAGATLPPFNPDVPHAHTGGLPVFDSATTEVQS